MLLAARGVAERAMSAADAIVFVIDDDASFRDSVELRSESGRKVVRRQWHCAVLFQAAGRLHTVALCVIPIDEAVERCFGILARRRASKADSDFRFAAYWPFQR